MINLQTERAKAPTRVLSNIADENNMKYVLIGFVDENITQAEFNRVVWLPAETKTVSANTKSLPAPITWNDFSSRLKSYLITLEYTYNRKQEYPSMEDQLDIIFHQGIDVWKEQIQAIKDKYPKPE